MQEACLNCLDCGCAVFLDGFGILTAIESERTCVHSVDNKSLIRTETAQTVIFEKCSELTAFHRSKYAPLKEMNEIAKRVHPELPMELSVRWSEKELRRLLRGLIRQVMYEVITDGRCSLLPQIGVFYSLHNRQGKSYQEWWAGADIFLKPVWMRRTQVGLPRFFEAPVLRDAWEPFRAAYGDPLTVTRVHLKEELLAVGYEIDSDPEETMNVAIFEKKPENSNEHKTFLYVSDGLRGIALARGSDCGAEIVLQLKHDSAGSSPPSWPYRALALGWILMQASKSGVLGAGVGITCGDRLCPEIGSKLGAVITTRFSNMLHSSMCSDGRFSYMNIVGITAAEARLARVSSPEHLLVLLQRRGLDQLTKSNRPCLASFLGLPPEEESGETGRTEEMAEAS